MEDEESRVKAEELEKDGTREGEEEGEGQGEGLKPEGVSVSVVEDEADKDEEERGEGDETRLCDEDDYLTLVVDFFGCLRCARG